MIQQHPEGDFLIREVGVSEFELQVPVNALIEIYLSLLVKLQQGKCSYRLGQGRELKDTFIIYHFPGLHVCISVVASPDDTVIFYQAGANPDELVFIHKFDKKGVEGRVSRFSGIL